ncbi:tRNA (adenosine(37)-N6)-dimethylallyltransferase MiaA [Candidatus Fermentibacterales bacterium]|nr:tRNA (adenosine(37)-N6)-dimethylallyltransferase MiaA [Candidatus Fermentibacterales bacterium]
MEGSTESRRVPVLLGCTASGKSALAMRMAELGPLEIVSADSRQVYRMMDIGTAKPSKADRAAVRHHMIDLADPSEPFSAARFARQASALIESMLGDRRAPLVVGGAGLYLLALAGRLDELPGRDEALRNGLGEAEALEPGLLARFLSVLDPASMSAIGSPRDLVRIVRALEIALLTGQRASDLRSGGNEGSLWSGGRPPELVFVGLRTEDADLKRSIELRVDSMIAAGLPEEVEHLYRGLGYGRDNSVLGCTIGYAELMDHMDGLCSMREARDSIVVNTWRFTRRQLRMFRRIGEVSWTGSSDPCEVRKLLYG